MSLPKPLPDMCLEEGNKLYISFFNVSASVSSFSPGFSQFINSLITYCSLNISEVWLIPLYRCKLWHPCPAVSGFWFADAIVVLFAVLCYHRFQ
jgi:hypothetical protein